MPGTQVVRGDEGLLTLENVQIIFRNFAGNEGQFNRAGDRNFCVLLDTDTANAMIGDSWNVKATREREVDDQTVGGDPYLPVSVGYKNRPPLVVIVTSRGRTPLGENEVEILDWVDIEHVDLTIRPYHWSVSNKKGVKAYLKTMFVFIREDYLEQKYANLPLAIPSKRQNELPAGENENYGDDIIEGEVIEGDDQGAPF